MSPQLFIVGWLIVVLLLTQACLITVVAACGWTLGCGAGSRCSRSLGAVRSGLLAAAFGFRGGAGSPTGSAVAFSIALLSATGIGASLGSGLSLVMSAIAMAVAAVISATIMGVQTLAKMPRDCCSIRSH